MRPLAILAIVASVLAACSSNQNTNEPLVTNPPNPPLPQTEQSAPSPSRLGSVPSTGSNTMCPPGYMGPC
jgi:hypothetical protein